VKRIQIEDVLDLAAYERIREESRACIIELKRPRRISVGDRLTFVFENRDTVQFQIQEMLRAERLVKEDQIQAELDIYNELIPGAHELSATLMIEHVRLDVGGTTVHASFDPKQFEEDRISAVQYVRFPLGPELAARFADLAVPVVLGVAHPNYRASAVIEGASRESLVLDLKPDAEAR
jgi:hypothetical protein